MTEFTYKLRKVRETKGAVLYQEVNDGGKELDMHTGAVATQYFRKNAFVGGIPENVTVKVSY